MDVRQPKGQIGREVQETDVLFNLDIKQLLPRTLHLVTAGSLESSILLGNKPKFKVCVRYSKLIPLHRFSELILSSSFSAMINSPEFQLTPSAMHHHMERAFYGGSNPRGGGVHPHTTHKAARPHHFGFSPPPQQQACFCTSECLSHPALLLEYIPAELICF